MVGLVLMTESYCKLISLPMKNNNSPHNSIAIFFFGLDLYCNVDSKESLRKWKLEKIRSENKSKLTSNFVEVYQFLS